MCSVCHCTGIIRRYSLVNDSGMKFLLDQDVYASTARFLIELGHNVVPAAQIGLSRADDEELLKVAQEQGRILITRDRDFGDLVFMKIVI